jgi:nucleosome binding factor SPN SPT16 subunit
MKHGAVARDVYNHAVSFIKERKPELEKHFVKNIGFGVRQCSIFTSPTLTMDVSDGNGVP